MPRDLTLEGRLKRLMFFRIVMMTTLLLIALSVEATTETLLPVTALYGLIACTYGLTLLYVVALRVFPQLEPQVYVQTVLDLGVVTGLVYLTGGTGNRGGFMLLYPIVVLSASALLYRRRGLLLAGVATLFHSGTLWAVRQDLIPPQGLSDVPGMPLPHILYSIFLTSVACVTVALIGSYFTETLHSVGERLEQAAEQVADLQELHNVVVRSIQSGLATADLQGRILYMNEFGESILGCKLADLRGRTVRDVLGSVMLGDAALRARTMSRGLERLEVAYASPNGKYLDLGVSVSPLATSDAAGAGYLLVFQNLTEIKQLEREVRTKDKLAAVGEMAAQLAHEIRNPLGSISGSAQVLMSEPNISADQGRLLAIITRESRRLSDSLNQFLFQVKPSTGQVGPVDLGHLVAEAVTLLRNGSEVGPDHRITFDAEGGPHVCLADPNQITQVFWNLTRNALEAMPGGGTLRIRLAMEGDSVVLSVSDEGRGIRREDKGRIFEPFRSGTPLGSGLGLAIVYQIVSQHRGDIGVISVPNRGTEVQMRLPAFNVNAAT